MEPRWAAPRVEGGGTPTRRHVPHPPPPRVLDMCDPPPRGTHAQEGDMGRATQSSPRQAGPTLSVALCVPRGQHRGAEEALAVLVAPADLVAALGELLRGAGDAAIVLVPGAIAAGLAREGWDTGGSAAALPWRPPPEPEVPMRRSHRLLPGSPLSGRGLSYPQPFPSALSPGSPLPSLVRCCPSCWHQDKLIRPG